MKTALDAMGGDNAPVETVQGAVLAAREYGIEIVLVGKPDAIQAELAKADTSGLKLPVEPAASVIPMDEHAPSTAWRRQRDSSLSVALQLLADGKVDAVVSAGNTGAVVSGGTFIVHRIDGIDRPALGVPFPAMGDIGKVFIADVGATPDAKPHFLVQWARMASIYTERVMGVPNPRVGIVSNGEEEIKGSELVRETFPLLQASGLNFIGNVEGKDIPSGVADVVVTDGFTGNVIIKTVEGTAKMILDLLRSELTSSLPTKLLAAGLRPNFRRIGARLDYAEYGGSIVMGVNGILIKPHGRSNAKAIKNAIRVGKSAVEQNIMSVFRELGEQEGVVDNNPEKNAAMRAFGATVLEVGRDFDEAREHVEALQRSNGLRYVHSANEPDLIAGVATYALELFEELPDVETILVPIGGGSGACGCALVRSFLASSAEVIGVQAEGADAFTRSWRTGTRVVGERAATFAEGMATRVTFDLTFSILRDYLDDIVTLSEEELREGVRLALRTTHNLAEGAGAASLAAAVKMRDRLRGRTVACVMSGGNIDQGTLARLLSTADCRLQIAD